MGKSEIGILGKIRGKVGPVVGSVWRGVNVIKAMPAKSNKPPTMAQLDQQARFGLVTSFLGNASSLINIGYQFSDGVETPMNTATQFHLKNAVVGVYPNYTIDYTRVELSNGKLAGLEKATVTAVPASQSITLAWDALDSATTAEQLVERNKDKVMVYVYSAALDKYTSKEGAFTRGELTKTFYIPSLLRETPLHVWVFVKSEKGKLVSSSQYLGVVNFPAP